MPFLDKEGLAYFWNQIIARLSKYETTENAQLKLEEAKSYTDNSIPTKVTDLENDAEYITADALSGLGGGDMLKATYDKDDNGVVDDSEKLGGVAASEYAKKTDIPTETDPVFKASAAAGITSAKIQEWNNKSNFSGNYNDLTNKPTNLATEAYVDEKVAEAGGNIAPGDFLELDEDGTLNIVPSYTIPEEEVTENFHIYSAGYDENTSKYVIFLNPSRIPKTIVSYSHEDGPNAGNWGTDEFNIESVIIEDGKIKVILTGYFEDYSGDGRIVTVTYVAEEEVRTLMSPATKTTIGAVKPGKFLDISKDGALNVSTTSSYEGGTTTQTSTTFDYVDMDTYKATIYSEYPIKEVTDFQYNVYGSWESTSGYTISADRRSISYSYGPCSELYIKATYSYDAGELSLFDGIEKMTVKSSMYGTTLPSSGQEGQVFFLLK